MEESVNFYNPSANDTNGVKMNYYIFSNNRIHIEGFYSINPSPAKTTLTIKLPITVSKITNVTFSNYDINVENTNQLKRWNVYGYGNSSSTIAIELEYDDTDTWNGILFTVDGYI